jgi:hypothetical protein
MPGLALGLFIAKPQPGGDAPAIDGALTTELAEPLIAENGDILVFEPASGGTPAVLSNTRSIDFDGTDDNLSCGNVATLNSATNFTLSMWVNNHAARGTVTHYFASGTGTICRVRKGGSGEIRFHIGGTQITTGGDTYTQNAWQHIMITVNGSTARIFLNGVLKVEGTSMPSMASTSGDGFFIGQYTTGIQRLNGELDEFAIWDTTLSDGGVSDEQTATQDVAAIYNNGIPTDLSLASSYDTDRTSNLTHWWRMEEGSGTSVVNTANSGTNDATLNNGPTFSTNVPS